MEDIIMYVMFKTQFCIGDMIEESVALFNDIIFKLNLWMLSSYLEVFEIVSLSWNTCSILVISLIQEWQILEQQYQVQIRHNANKCLKNLM